jgi:CcmD family protein
VIVKVALLVALLLVPAAVQAQTAQPPSSSAQEGFVPVDKPLTPQDTIPAPRLVGAAYGFIWLALFGYVWTIRTRLAKVERELERAGRQAASHERRP